MKLTKEQKQAAIAAAEAQLKAEAADYARPYAELANSIAAIVGAKNKLSEKMGEVRDGLWSAFRKSLAVGMAAGHSADNIAVGLTVACEEAGVPGGSSRSYIGTIRNMYAEIAAGGPLTLEEAEEMAIKDARQRYMDADKRALKEARERLQEAVKGWTAAQLDELTALANAETEARAAEKAAAEEAAKLVANG